MLSDIQYQLLTAYVDGELDDRDRQAVQRLVHESPAARALLKKLQEDAKRIQQLPRAQLDARFPGQVVEAILAQRQVVTLPPAPVQYQRYHAIGLGMAASILIVITIGSWLLLSTLRQRDPVEPAPVVQRPRDPAPQKKELDPQFAALMQGAFARYGEPVPEIGKRLAIHDAALVKELATIQEPAVYLEIRCRDVAEVLRRLQAVLGADGVKLWVDPKVQARLNTEERADYVVFAENLAPPEVNKLLAQAAEGDQFDTVLFSPLTFEHRKELSALLGVKLFHIEPRRFDTVAIERDPQELGFGKNGQPIRAKQLLAPRPQVPAPERAALVVSAAPGESRGVASEATRRFVGSRRGNRPGTLQVVIVIQQSL